MVAVAAMMMIGASGCGAVASPGTTKPPPTAETPTAETPAADPEPSLRDVDFAGMEWTFAPGGLSEPIVVQLTNGSGTLGGATIGFDGEVVYSDANGDGVEEAAAALTYEEGNAYRKAWFIWMLQNGEPVQVPYPFAEESRCGHAVHSVAAAPGGFLVDETVRLAPADDHLSCAEPGTGVRQRTVGVLETGGQVWPQQIAPVAAWGGACPGTDWWDTEPASVVLLAAPSADAPAVSSSEESIAPFLPRVAPTFAAAEGWSLVVFQRGDGHGQQCGWSPKA